MLLGELRPALLASSSRIEMNNAEQTVEQVKTEAGSVAGHRPRVTIVTSIHPDFDKRVWRHARGLAVLEYEVTLICPWKVASGSTVDGVTLVTFDIPKSLINRLTRIPVRIVHEIRALGEKAGVVHFHDPDLLPWMALLSLRRSVVYDVHENYPDEIERRLRGPRVFRKIASAAFKWTQWLLSRIIRNIVLVTPHQESSFPGKGFNSIYVKNYASRTLLEDVKDDYFERENVVAFVGAQHENNGSFLMLEIVAACQQAGVECTFIAPDYFSRSDVRDRYLAIRREMNLEEIVELFPPVKPSEIIKVLNRCRVAINPNLRVEQQIKGIHTKMYEFMAAGVPVVASDLPHQQELIGSASCGFSVPPEKPEAFVQAIERLLQNPAEAQELGRRGQEYFSEECTWESQMQLLDRYYRKLVINGGK